MITISDLSVSYGDKLILKNLNFEFEKGKIYAVMGPNGSGKSTLAYSIMGHPTYTVDKDSRILANGEDITNLEAHERADKGIFLSFQSPLSLAGVKVHQLLQIAMKGRMKPLDLRNKIKEIAKDLHIPDDLLSRSLNEGASGGEKKKLEVLQSMVLPTEFVIFDEVDTGVDVDSLKTISQYLDQHRGEKTYLIITHYNRILHHLKPDKILVIVNGELKKVGDHTLAEQIEKEGYNSIM